MCCSLKDTMKYVFFIVLGALLAAACADADGWPMFRCNPQHTGCSTGDMPERLQVLWKYKTNYSVASSPAVCDGKVYCGSGTGVIYCLAADTGDIVWTYETGGRITASPAIADRLLYIGSWDTYIYCFGAGKPTLSIDSHPKRRRDHGCG